MSTSSGPSSGGSLIFLLLPVFSSPALVGVWLCGAGQQDQGQPVGQPEGQPVPSGLKVSLLLVASLLYPIILASLGEEDPLGQACTQGL